MVSRSLALCCLVWICFQPAVLAQDVSATARVDSNTILIGDWLALHIDVQHSIGTTVRWPTLPDSLEGFEVIRRSAPAVKNDGKSILESAAFVMTAFDSGLHVVPPLMFRYSTQNDTSSQTAETSPIPIFVRGLAVDTTNEIKDVKPPLNVPLSLAEILPYLIGGIGIGGILWLIYYLTKRRKKGVTFIPEAPSKPPHEIALEELRALEAERLWQRGKVKEYYSRLTDIVRTYIERKFVIPAMEMTTDEILASPVVARSSPEFISQLREMLVRADFVKFAKFLPSNSENESSMNLAISYVESTSAEVHRQMTTDVPEEVKV